MKHDSGNMAVKVRAEMNVLIVDDHPVVISGCRSVFSIDPTIKLHAAGDQRSGLKSYIEVRPDVAVLDINLPDLSGFELLRRILKVDRRAKIIVFSMNDDPAFVVRAIELGAKGYVSKSDDPKILLKAVRMVLAGEQFITPQLAAAVTFSGPAIRANPTSQLSTREMEILRLLAKGSKIIEIADALDVSYKTIANLTSMLKQKLEAKSHADLIRIAVEMGLT